MGHSVNGRNLCGIIGVYLVIKSLLNLILSFGFGNIVTLVVAVGLFVLLTSGFKAINYITVVLVAIPVIANIKNNITDMQILYLIEALLDAICIIQLIVNRDIKEHCKVNND